MAPSGVEASMRFRAPGARSTTSCDIMRSMFDSARTRTGPWQPSATRPNLFLKHPNLRLRCYMISLLPGILAIQSIASTTLRLQCRSHGSVHCVWRPESSNSACDNTAGKRRNQGNKWARAKRRAIIMCNVHRYTPLHHRETGAKENKFERDAEDKQQTKPKEYT